MSTVLRTLATKAKEHHESVNAAYATYYSSGSSSNGMTSSQPTPAATPRPSLDTPHNTSNTSAPPSRSPSPSSPPLVAKAWKSLKKAAKDHHDSVNAAYSTYYAPGISSPSSQASSRLATPRESLDGVREGGVVVEGVKKESAWTKAKRAAKEHHREMNKAYATYYGTAMFQS
jgi:hypothetical protein